MAGSYPPTFSISRRFISTDAWNLFQCDTPTMLNPSV